MKDRIIVAGDIHAEWGILNTMINKNHPSMILQAGDFGFWPNVDKYNIGLLKPNKTKIHWCDGNHEDFWSLKKRSSDEIMEDIVYQPRGSVLTLPDGRNVLFFGGGLSIDKEIRTLGFSWFPEEIPSHEDFMRLDEIKVKIDIVISHTCPHEFKIEEMKPRSAGRYFKASDPTRDLLSYVLNEFRPDLWYFGHWHFSARGEHNGTNWRALNMAGETSWWMDLE